MTVFISVDGSREGPYTAEQLEELLRAGAIPTSALYWVAGEENWRPISDHPGFARSSATSAPPQTASSTASFRRFKLGPLPKLAIGGGVMALVVLLYIVGPLLSEARRPRLAPNSSAGQTQASNAPTPERAAASPPVLPPAQAAPTVVAGSAANPVVSAGASPTVSAPEAVAVLPSPRIIVADFYAWYLEEIRDDRSPWLSGELAKRPEVSCNFALRINQRQRARAG